MFNRDELLDAADALEHRAAAIEHLIQPDTAKILVVAEETRDRWAAKALALRALADKMREHAAKTP